MKNMVFGKIEGFEIEDSTGEIVETVTVDTIESLKKISNNFFDDTNHDKILEHKRAEDRVYTENEGGEIFVNLQTYSLTVKQPYEIAKVDFAIEDNVYEIEVERDRDKNEIEVNIWNRTQKQYVIAFTTNSEETVSDILFEKLNNIEELVA